MADLYCLSEVIDFSALQEPLKHSQRIKYTCIGISEHFIVLGSSSGSIYLFNEAGKFLHLIPNGNGTITKVQISANEKYIAFAQRSKICVYAVNLSANAAPQVILSHLSSEVACIRWTKDEKQFFFGDTRGQVNLVVLSSFIGHSMLLNMTIHPILFLESAIVQIDDFESLLLVSTFNKCILCNTEYEEYKQIGNKPRDGAFGACFAISMDEAARPSRIYCARPGTRFWEADFEGDVIQTHQFKTALAVSPSKIHKIRFNEDENIAKYEENYEMLDYAPQNLQFGKIQMLAQGFLLAYTELGLYIFDMSSKSSDMSTSRVVLWCNQFERILDCKVLGQNIYIFTQTGSLYCVKLMTIQVHACSLVRNSRLLDCACLMRKHVKYFADKSREDYGLNILSHVKNFLIDKQEYELLNDLSVIFDAIVQCESSVDNNSSGGSSITAERYNSMSSTASAQCHSTTPKNVYVLENAFCDNLKPQKSYDGHFKDALLTVTGKFGKNIIKYKFNIFAEEQQKLVQELIPSKDRSMPFKEIKILHENEEEIVCRNRKPAFIHASQLAESDANLHISSEEKTIYNLYLICKSSEIGNTKFVERYRAVFDEYSARELIFLMTKLETLMVEHGDETEKAKKNCYEMYFNYLNPELLWEVDEETRDYISEGFVFLNANKDMVLCENCAFPLRFDTSCVFHELGAVLLRYYWSRSEQTKCFNVLTQVPALFDVLAKLYIVEGNTRKVLPIVLNYGQPELIREVGKSFNFTAWMQCFEMFKEYQYGRLMCVNCDSVVVVENVNRHFFYSWNCFLDIALEHLCSEDILSLVYKLSSCIANDALDRDFYIKCLLKS